MTEANYLWTPTPVQSLPVRGSDQRLPINRLFFVGRNYHAHAVEMGRPVDKSGFRTRMLAAQFLLEAGHVEGTSNRPAMGYRLADRDEVVVFPRTFSPRS